MKRVAGTSDGLVERAHGVIHDAGLVLLLDARSCCPDDCINLGVALWNSKKVDKKLPSMDEVIEEGLGKLDDKVTEVDRTSVYIVGVLDGAGLTRRRRRR